MKQIPYYQEQSARLLETGSCDLPLNYEDVAHKVKHHPNFAVALRNSVNGDHRLLEMITITAANVLCKEFEDAA